MAYLIAQQQIRTALSLAGLSYVEDLNPNLTAQLGIWLSGMLNAPRNLTAIREPDAAIHKHVIEPLVGRHRLIGADLPMPHGPMIDIGSGNGAPGLPYALCEPERASILLDSRTGAADFLSEVVALLDAPHIGVLRERAEFAAHTEMREGFSLAISRAVAPPATALELMVPFLQVGGIAAAWTGELPLAEMRLAEQTAHELGAEITPIDPPQDILIATKTRHTNARYPRSWNQMRRRPLSPSRPPD